MFAILILFILFQSSTAAIHKLNESDYARMPPVFLLEQYEECFDVPEAIYCSAEILLVSDEPSELLTMIEEYSAYVTHYNHTLLRHGYCMNKSCKKFYNDSEVDLRLSLEACVNETLYNKYKLKAKVLPKNFDCSKRDRDLPIDFLDIFVGLICILILAANLIASYCDFCLKKRMDRGGLRYLYCFSIYRNWKKFIASPSEDLQAFKGIHGIRAINMYSIVCGHAFFYCIAFIINPELLEELIEVPFYHIFLNGTLIMQTFLIVSSFLMVHKWLTWSEQHTLSWYMLPQQIMMRWLRFSLSYALIIGLTVTWFGRLATGPFWKRIIYDEMMDCRRDWWKHLLYINNYFDDSTCMPQTWYLAADTQLFFVGIIFFLICRTGLTRKVGLSLLFILGMIIPALHVYYQHIDGALVQTPERAMRFFANNPTFHHLYKRGHTNLTGYVIGMALGYMIYNWQKSGGDPKKFQKYRYVYWTLVIWAGLCTFSSVIFYQDVEQPIYVHMLFAALLKPAFGIIMAIILAGVVIQFEGIYRPILEWQPFMYLGRLSFSAYMVHIAYVKASVVSISALHRISKKSSIFQGGLMVTVIYIAAFVFLMLVESPSANLIREFFGMTYTQNKEDTKESLEECKKAEAEDINVTENNLTQEENGVIVVKMGTKI